MDSFDGLAQEPMTLHKYLYANADPVNMIDPTGNFSLGSFGAANNIQGILSSYRVKRAMNFLYLLDFASDPTGAITDRLTDKAFGAIVILGRLGKSTGDLFRRLVGGCRSKKKNNSFTAGTNVHTAYHLSVCQSALHEPV